MEAGGSEMQGPPQLRREFETLAGYEKNQSHEHITFKGSPSPGTMKRKKDPTTKMRLVC